MPYVIREVKGTDRPFKIVNTDKNKIVGSSKTRAKAKASIRARHAGKHK